jgi:hypothetical protein
MRLVSLILAAMLAAATFPSGAATMSPAWGAAANAAGGGALFPATGRLAATDARGDLAVVAATGDGHEGCLVTLKYSGATGVLAWRRDACGPGAAGAAAVAIDAAGDVIVAGNSAGTFRLVKYSGATGAPMWEQRAGGGALDLAWGLALDPAGNVLLMGKAAGFSTEVWVAKHRGSDGALAWQQPVDCGAETTPVGIAADGAGNALIAGNFRNSSGGDDWYAARLAGSSGAVLWRKMYDSGLRDEASGIAVDRAGDVIVTGISATPGGHTVAKTVKSAGATGRTLWERDFSGPGSSGARALAIDGAGNVVVTGFAGNGTGGDDIATVKYAANGTPLWHASHAVAGSGRDAGHGVAVDAAGDVVVTGATHALGAAAPQMRTIRYASADGAEQWSFAENGAGAADRGLAVVAGAHGVHAVGSLTQPGMATGLRVLTFAGVDAPPSAALNVHGLWWKDASESGWGVNLTQQGEVLFATWFTYDEQGQGLWLVMSHGARVGDNSYTGTLYRMRGPAFNATPFESAKVAAHPVGTASFSFTDADHGLFRYTVNGVSGAKAITRQVFATPLPTCGIGLAPGGLPNYQDLWWSRGGAEPGWGLNVTHQGDTLFVTWFTYGGAGDGIWLVGSSVARTGNATYSGTLYRTVGPPLHGAAWNAAQVGIAAAGHATLVFSDDDNATFTYTLDGVSQSKPISRQVFATPKSVCR